MSRDGGRVRDGSTACGRRGHRGQLARRKVAAFALAAIALGAFASGAAAHVAGVARDIPFGGRLQRSAVARIANLPYGGGPVVHWNRTHAIFWEPSGSGMAFEPGYTAFVETFLRNVAADSHEPTNVYSLTGQYRDHSGRSVYDSRYAGAVFDTDPMPANGCTEPLLTGPGWATCLTDTQLQAEIAHVVAANGLPTGLHDIYVLVTPSGFGSCIDSTGMSCALGGANDGYCAYHGNTPDDRILYAVMPYVAVPNHCQYGIPRPNSTTADPLVSYISHEHNEIITDPLGDRPAWIDFSSNEDGDLCLGQYGPVLGGSGAGVWDQVIHGAHYYLQMEYSNDDGACRARDESDRVSFRISRSGRKATFTAHAKDPDGRIASYTWSIGKRIRHGRVVKLEFTRHGAFKVVLKVVDQSRNWAFSTGTYRR